MSSSFDEPVGLQASTSLALMPEESKQKNQTENPKLTPHQQRKKDALDLAELIYKIYNENCPVGISGPCRKGEKNV